MKKNGGYTLLELLVVVAIVFALVGVALPIGLDFYNQYLLTEERDNLVQVLRKARSEAMANINQKPHGVAFLANQYVLFQGASYASRDTDWDRFYNHSGKVSLDAPAQIIFSHLEGASASSTVSLSDASQKVEIKVSDEGRISW